MKRFGFREWTAIFVILLICILVVWCAVCLHGKYAIAEEEIPEPIVVTVITDNLNARLSANKHSMIMTELEKGTELEATGRWSKDHRWIELLHPECGKVWCYYKYLSERTDVFEVETLWDEPLKIRKEPFNGRVTGYLRKGRTVTVTQVVLGWGKCAKGWLDLEYCIEIEDGKGD